MSYVRFFRSFQTKHALSVFEIIRITHLPTLSLDLTHIDFSPFLNYCVSYIKHFKWRACCSGLTLSMLAILPDPPSKLWMHSKLIKWVTALQTGQSQLVPVNCVSSNWQTINGFLFLKLVIDDLILCLADQSNISP